MAEWSLGVDLGTTFSAGAIATGEHVELLEVGGERRVPSTVLLADDGQLVAGSVAQRMIGRSPERAERNPKRLVGRGPMLLGGEEISVGHALATLLDLFVSEARRRFDGSLPTCLVLTHPVAWSTDRRDVLREAADRVLPEVEVRLLDEPVASAVHHAHEHALDVGDAVAVYDLGGGTFDAAVLTSSRDGFRVVGTPGGDPDIGGEGFDERVYRHFGAQLERLAPQWWLDVCAARDRRALAAAAELRTEARLAKETLSNYDTAEQYIHGADVDVRITRAELDGLIGADIARTVAILAEAIGRSGRSADQLRGIFLTGGASRTALVEQTLRTAYGDRVRTWQDPKNVVALGAARWGQPPRSLGGTSSGQADNTVAMEPLSAWREPSPANVWAKSFGMAAAAGAKSTASATGARTSKAIEVARAVASAQAAATSAAAGKAAQRIGESVAKARTSPVVGEARKVATTAAATTSAAAGQAVKKIGESVAGVGPPSTSGGAAPGTSSSWAWWVVPTVSLVAGMIAFPIPVAIAVILLLLFGPFTGAWLGLLAGRYRPDLPAWVAPLVGAAVWLVLSVLAMALLGNYNAGSRLLATSVLWLPGAIVLIHGGLQRRTPRNQESL